MDKEKNTENDRTKFMPLGMCIGVAIGCAIGAAAGNIGTYMCMGLSIGMAVGVALDNREKQQNGEETK